jgi:hypothetical protein
MRSSSFPAVALAISLALSASSDAIAVLETQGKAQTSQEESRRGKNPSSEPAGSKVDDEAEQARRAKARQPDERQAPSKASPPPPRVLPPKYYAPPRVYYFPPVSLHRGFYYHPYFGFYYGPYYGPFYPYPGPSFGPRRFGESALRTRVTPAETHIYVNGYYAGRADDFDGFFQRLYVPAGQHTIDLFLEGFRSQRFNLYLSPGDTREITHDMVRLTPGETAGALPTPRALPREWAVLPESVGDRPASPFGILAIWVDPADAQVVVDGELWQGAPGRTEYIIHLPTGWHQLEVRREGLQTFRTGIELSEGVTTRLNVRLVP